MVFGSDLHPDPGKTEAQPCLGPEIVLARLCQVQLLWPRARKSREPWFVSDMPCGLHSVLTVDSLARQKECCIWMCNSSLGGLWEMA